VEVFDAVGFTEMVDEGFVPFEFFWGYYFFDACGVDVVVEEGDEGGEGWERVEEGFVAGGKEFVWGDVGGGEG